MQPLAELLSSEHGKVVADSKGDVQRGLEVIEFACGVPHALKGEYTEGAGPRHRRLFHAPAAGRGGGHHPVQLPGHDPDVDVRCGDRGGQYLHPEAQRARSKPVPVRLGELMMEAGANLGMDLKGVLNVVNGDKVVVDAILHHPDIKAVSFVGSSDIAQYVYVTGAQHGKRVQAMGGGQEPRDHPAGR